MADPLPLPPPQVPLARPTGKSTQQGFEFLERLRSSVKTLAGITNIFNNLTATASTALLDVFTSTLKGLVPASGGGTTNFLRADGTFAAPPAGTGGLTLLSSASVGAGTTYSVTALGGYKVFLIFFRAVSHNNGAAQTLRVALSGNNGSSYGTAFLVSSTTFLAAASIFGFCMVDRLDQTNNQSVSNGVPVNGVGGQEGTSIGPINALQFSFSAGNFDAGEIDIYGLK